jgi:AcrR family transcriptional regulator
MTGGAIYGYFPTRDDLVTTLTRELYTALVDRLAASRFVTWAEALRDWAVANPRSSP